MSTDNATNADFFDTPAGIQFLINLQTGCSTTDLIDGLKNGYDYKPSLAAGILFCVLFGLSFLAHTFQFARLRRWTSILLALGAMTELIGWAGRTWSAKCPYEQDAFLMQIATLIIAPTFFSAALYVLLGIMIRILGRESSLISANMYAIVFCVCDIISLVVQAVGGGLASTADNNTGGSTKTGTNIMIAGIVFQLFTLTIFGVLMIDFLRRTIRMALPRGFRTTLIAICISFTMLYIRGIYRTVELAQGWTGYLITHEGYFIGLDAAIMVVAVAVFNFLDPAILIPKVTDARGASKSGLNSADASDNAGVQMSGYP